LGLLGLGADHLAALRAAPHPPPLSPLGRGVGGERRHPARAAIYGFLSGGLSQLDSFHLKQDAPADTRGDFKPIPTRTPGAASATRGSSRSRPTTRPPTAPAPSTSSTTRSASARTGASASGPPAWSCRRASGRAGSATASACCGTSTPSAATWSAAPPAWTAS